ncbi:unnamed protein product, partial [marine sediment metagenome]
AKSLKDRILEALKKEGLTLFELSDRLKMPKHYVRQILWNLEGEGLIRYNFETGKWCLKRR